MSRVTGPEPAPPAERTPLEALHEHLAASRQHLDQVARAIKDLGSPGVLETATVTIGTHGMVTRSYRVPYASVVVANLSLAGPVTFTSAGPMGSAPGGGQGQVQVPAGGAGAWNMTGTALTFYGPVGAVISYGVMVHRIPPAVAAAAAIALPYGQASITAASAVTAPTAGQAIVSTAALGTGLYQVTVLAYLTGSPVAGTDADNIELMNGTAVAAPLLLPPAADIAPSPQVFTVRGTGAALSVAAIGAGTAAVGYRASITATQIGP